MKHARPKVLMGALLLVLAGCATRKPPNGENYYVQATEEYNQHFYEPAINDYQKLIDQYPFSPYAQEAELNIGLAYYKMHNYAEAIGSFNDFLRMHPTSKHLDVASYYLAMSHFDQMGHPDQDQTHTQLALEQFQTIERRFPESDFAAIAGQDIAICREMLARHDFLIGNFYYGRANYKAAESRMAETVARYPNTPIAPRALEDLGRTLQKQGKKYSAAQAYTALARLYPNTSFAADAKHQLANLKQSIDTEEDPLKMVLAESGFGDDQAAGGSGVSVHESLANLTSGGGSGYGADGLPIFDSGNKPASNPPVLTAQAGREEANPGRATLRKVRLSSSDPPLSVVLDLTGPVNYDDKLKNGADYSTLTLLLKGVTPDSQLARHLVFDKSIFRDCDIEPAAGGTRVTVNTTPVSRFAIVPLQQPARLLVTFTPQGGSLPVSGQTASSGNSASSAF